MQEYVTYESFGAAGDGKTDDMAAIVAAHAYANEHHLPVRAAADASYYIGGHDLTAVIKTDTDWNTARFLVDDTSVENKDQTLFLVPETYTAEPLSLTSLKREQKRLDRTFPGTCLVSVRDETRRNYIRKGPNQSNGAPVSDTFLVSADGGVLNDIMWDFPQITSATCRQIEEKPLVIRGGHFTTIANQRPSAYTYYARDIWVRRSHTTLSGITHRIMGEGEHGAPYGGFLRVSGCAYVTLSDCSLTGHKIYITQGVGSKVPMGSYDISLGGAAFVTLSGITQVQGIMDNTRWGLMGSNYCKDITLENCVMSRFDAHMGVTNATVRGCRLGWQRVEAIGMGRFLVEDSEISGWNFIQLRHDYGGHWDGEMTIRHCVFRPTGEHPSILSGANDEDHDFGYPCKMPHTLTIDGLTVVCGEETKDVACLGNYRRPDPDAPRPYPYEPTHLLRVRGLQCTDGREVMICRTPSLFPDLAVEKDFTD